MSITRKEDRIISLNKKYMFVNRKLWIYLKKQKNTFI